MKQVLCNLRATLSRCLWVLRILLLAALPFSQAPVVFAQSVHYDTDLTKCPGQQKADYFYYYEDIPSRRGATWCEATDAWAATQSAGPVQPNNRPIWVTACVPGAYWTYSHGHLDDPSYRFDSPPYAGINMVCSAGCPTGTIWKAEANACIAFRDLDRAGAPPKAAPPTTEKPQSCEKQPDPNPEFGNPIYPLLGTKREEVATGVGIGKLQLRLIYDSAAEAPMATGGSRPVLAKPLVLGPLWSSTLHRKLLVQAEGKGALVARGDGRTVSFTGNGAGVYTAEADISDRLISVTGGYRYIDAAGQALERYDSAGKLTAIHWVSGQSVTLSYSTSVTSDIAPAAGYLVQAQDSLGRTVRFAYQLPAGADPATGGQLAKITDAQGQAMNLGYDATGNLSTLTWPDGKSRTFHYENASFARGLTGITDELGVRYATFGYDSTGRAISTEYVGGVGSYSTSYTNPPQIVVTETYDSAAQVIYRTHDWEGAQGTEVTTPQGGSVAIDSTLINGKSYLTNQSQPAGSGCAASTSAMSYDANGNLASRDDFSGNRTCYVSDLTRNLQTTRVEGLATTASCAGVTPANASLPAGSRKTSTAWHPDWPLAVRVAEPGRLTTNVYNGQPDPTASNAIASCAPSMALLPDGKPIAVLCKQVAQATTDTNGSLGFGAVLQSGPAASTRQWTYNQNGQVLTETDGNGGGTSRSYYTDRFFSGSDPYFDKVTLLLRGMGTDGSTAIVDESLAGKTMTAYGNAQISTAQSYLGGSSLKLDGNGDYVGTTSGLSDFMLGTGDFTIEFFARKSANGPNNYDIALSTYSTSNASDGYYLELSASRGFLFGGPSTIYVQYNVNPNDSTWHHWAVSRAGTSLKLFKDGVVVATATNSVSLSAANLKVGTNRFNEYFNGYLHMRVTKGVARYTGNFTPPTEFLKAVQSSAAMGHNIGDLQSTTNAAGHVTQFTQYDQAGRVLKMVDSKDVVTDLTYTPRGWISTVATTPPGGGARVTTYTYDNAGQVTGLALPNGTELSYSYDAAHRLVGVTDARGNTVSYTLDNIGNRIAEEVRDPTGTVQRSIGRSFDALNRLQQVTGAAR